MDWMDSSLYFCSVTFCLKKKHSKLNLLSFITMEETTEQWEVFERIKEKQFEGKEEDPKEEEATQKE
jgi:hypothetical protein